MESADFLKEHLLTHLIIGFLLLRSYRTKTYELQSLFFSTFRNQCLNVLLLNMGALLHYIFSNDFYYWNCIFNSSIQKPFFFENTRLLFLYSGFVLPEISIVLPYCILCFICLLRCLSLSEIVKLGFLIVVNETITRKKTKQQKKNLPFLRRLSQLI